MVSPESDLDSVDTEEQEKPKLTLEVKVDSPSTCQRHVTVSVPRPDIDRYFKEAFDDLVPKAEVPGFRSGRAPRKLVESMFREQMKNQVKGSLLMDAVSQVNEEAEFSAISEPDFDFGAIELPNEGPLTFEFDIEVRPDFNTPHWKGLALERPVYEYSDDEVEIHLKRLLARYGRVTTKEGPIEADDLVTLGIRFKDGETVVSKVESETISVKSKLSFRDANLEGFDQLLIGSKAGDRKQVKIKVSEEADNENLRGKELDAEFEIEAVKQNELSEMTPAFLDRIGGFENEDDLRDAVRRELERQLAYYQQKKVRGQITGILTQSAEWDLPPEMLRRQARRELERAVLELRSSGFDEDSIRTHENQLRQNSLQTTERALKEHFIFERIAEDEGVDAEPEDFDAEIRLIAMQSQDSPRRVRARLEKRGQMDALRNQIIERRVVGLITSHAEFAEVPFEPSKEDSTVAIDHAVGGDKADEEIPEAKYGGEAEQLPGTVDRS
ncbi:MAG: trigger factor [Pirellulaceae bacterium]